MCHRNRSAGFAAFRQRIAVFGLALCASVGVHAAPAPGARLTLREAIAATLEANPQLGLYRFRDEALAGERATAGLRPPLQANVGLEDALGSGEVTRFRRSEITLSLSQVIELGEQRDARVGVTASQRELLEAEQRITELELLTETTRRFIAVAEAQAVLELRQRATALAGETLAALQPLVTAGQTPASEQARANAALERARLAESAALTTLEAARVGLAGMWNGDANTFSGVAAELAVIEAPGTPTDLLLGLEANPAIQLFASEERLRDAELREAASARRGTLQWTAGIRNLRESGDTGFVFSASMPLGSRARASGAIAAAEARLREVSGEREVALNRMRTQLNTLHLQLSQAALEAQGLRERVLPPLREALEQTREAYLSGRYGYFELSAAQAEYLDAELALINAAAAAHLLRAEIEGLSGAALGSATREVTP